MLIYLSIRLEWQMAVATVIAMVHDIIISVGVYSIFQLEVTPGTVIAFLTILGYSIYDTIVVFDKVKENEGRVGVTNRMTYTDMVSLSMNQVLMRSINTTVVALLPVLSILLVGAVLLGAVTLEEFGLALFVGMLSGAYSSIFVAAPIATRLREREARYRSDPRTGRDGPRRGLGPAVTRTPVCDDLGAVGRGHGRDRGRGRAGGHTDDDGDPTSSAQEVQGQTPVIGVVRSACALPVAALQRPRSMGRWPRTRRS